MKTIIMSMASLLLFTITGLGCDYCLLTQGVSPLETSRGVGLRLDERYTRLSTLFVNGNRVDHTNDLETYWTTQVTAFYSLTSRLTLTAVVPFSRRFEREGDENVPEAAGARTPRQLPGLFKTGGVNSVAGVLHGGDGAPGSSFGLGDITLLARYQLFQRHSLASTLTVALQGGLRLPTGKTTAVNSAGETLTAHIQPGTGAFTYMAGLSASYAVKRVSITANGLVGLPTRGEVGDDSYEYGNSITYDTSIRYRLSGSLQNPLKVFATAGIAGEYREQELFNQEPVDGTGGHTVYVTPGIQFFFNPVIFEFSFWQPVIQNLDGEQLGETFKTYASFTFLLR